MAGASLKEYIAFLHSSVHPVSGQRPVAAEVFKAMHGLYPRSRRVIRMAHNLSYHGILGDGDTHRCDPSCFRQGIRLVVEGKRPK